MPAIGIIDNVKSNGFDLDTFTFPLNKTKTEKNIEKFIAKHKKGKLIRNIVSEPDHDNPHNQHGFNATELEQMQEMQEKPENNTMRIIGHNIDRLILKPSTPGNDSVLFICSESSFCNHYERRFTRVAEKMKNTTTLVFGKINYLLNEVPGVEFTHVPALVIKPDGKPLVKFDGKDFGTNEIIEWIKTQATKKVADILTNPEDSKIKKEKLKPTKYKKKQKDEESLDDKVGHPVGYGFIRAANRYFNDIDNEDENSKEMYGPEEHDTDSYDYDEDEEDHTGRKEEL